MDGVGTSYNMEEVSKESKNEFDLEESWTKYEGTFKESKKEGVGYLHMENGDVLLGEFSNDMANGLGIL